ncbi:MAG: fluoride efflux transporter CrcB [Cyanobacteria bacterium SID2]|nr:fluoride efflux transporter CrcB [Cyanobacteria bacterium SID2]MBP0004833.1 fluoride efflux transporter CrcB [Cyanobacteria bacterium SBC]
MLQPEFRNPIAVSLGAIAGALCRYYTGLWLTRWGTHFPFGTLFVNLTGSLLMGLFVTSVVERGLNVSPEIRILVAVGFLGSYTTFSSYELDTVNLIRSGRSWLAMGYWLGSAAFGIVGVQLGIILARWLR